MFDLTDCKLCKHICYRVSKARLERAVSQPAMKWTSVLLVSSFLQLNRKSEVMWACCYCFNRRKWALARTEGQFLGSQRTKKGTEARSNRGHSCTSGLLVSRTLNIFSQWPASCCRWFRETNQHNNQINTITDLSINYWRIFSESKWQRQTNGIVTNGVTSSNCWSAESDLWPEMTEEMTTSSCANSDRIRLTGSLGFTFQGRTGKRWLSSAHAWQDAQIWDARHVMR